MVSSTVAPFAPASAAFTIRERFSTASRYCSALSVVWKLLHAQEVSIIPLPLMISWSM